MNSIVKLTVNYKIGTKVISLIWFSISRIKFTSNTLVFNKLCVLIKQSQNFQLIRQFTVDVTQGAILIHNTITLKTSI